MGSPASPSPQSYDISDYITPQSIGFFTTLGLDVEFLQDSVDEWDNSPSYEAAVKSLPVVNDGAERGVKITSEFLESARKEETFQTRLQGAENDRKAVPNQRKRHIRLLK